MSTPGRPHPRIAARPPEPARPDAVILAAMRAAGESGASGAELAKRLGMSRAAVWARIEELRRAGYEILASPHHGYVLRAAPDRLHADDLIARLPAQRVVGRDIQVFQETSSTNNIVEKMARDGLAEGVVVFAEAQTEGRGRLGRRWHSPQGRGLWFSVLLRPSLPPQAATQLTVATAVAAARAIEAVTGLSPGIKWPNDLVFGTAKCAGILLELGAELDHIRYVIVGIGVDVNLDRSEIPTELRGVMTSLAIELGRPVDRASLAVAMLEELDRAYARLRAGDFHELGDEWMRRSATLGKRVVIHAGNRRVAGVAEALDEEGALLIRTEHGRIERIIGGDVTLEKVAQGANA
jgi:BirA family transcriptional regulator, biotin operon repressor / biotin---[acetyl-CoA-carboxylase] ligase